MDKSKKKGITWGEAAKMVGRIWSIIYIILLRSLRLFIKLLICRSFFVDIPSRTTESQIEITFICAIMESFKYPC